MSNADHDETMPDATPYVSLSLVFHSINLLLQLQLQLQSI